jgi:hypothetical protein
MLKRVLSVLALAVTLSVIGVSTVKDGPTPDPACYPNGCNTGN